MKQFVFNPFGKFIKLNFTCNDCSHIVQSPRIEIPFPDLFSNKYHPQRFRETEQVIISCTHCNKKYPLVLNTTYSGGNGLLQNVSDQNLLDIIEILE